MKAAIIIPARLQSTRLPRKLLLKETGKPLIQHTYEAACSSQLASTVIVAADDEELASCVREFGGEVCLTDPAHQSGTCRVAEVAANMSGYDVIVNVQGDEPELSGASIDHAISTLQQSSDVLVGTLATPLRDKNALNNPAVVKVVFDQFQNAMYFSRSPIPCAREWSDDLLHAEPAIFYQHIGIYAFRAPFLQQFVTLPPSKLEQIESLEQLRILNQNIGIRVGVVEEHAIGIDTPDDYAAFVRRHSN